MTKAKKPIYSAHEDTAGIHRNVMLMVMGGCMPAVINLHVETKWYEKTEPKKKKHNLDSTDTKRLEMCYLRRRLFPNSENVPPRRL